MSKNSENWYLGSSYIETIGFRRPAHKKGFFILRNTLVFIYLFKTWSDKCKSLLTQPDGHTNTPSIDLPDEENIYALKVRVIASQVLWVLRQSYCVHNQRGDYECEEQMYTWLLSFTADILSEEEMYQLWKKDKILIQLRFQSNENWERNKRWAFWEIFAATKVFLFLMIPINQWSIKSEQ